MKLRYSLIGALLLVVIASIAWQSPILKFRPDFIRYQMEPSFDTGFAYDNKTFIPSVSRAEADFNSPPSKLVILPHHLTASSLIASGASLLAGKDSPETVIVISPNHANTGQCDIVTSKNSWTTPFGMAKADTAIADRLLSSGTVCLDDAALVPEHGIAGLMPFVKYYLPEAKVVPLALKKNIDPGLFETLSEIITSLSLERTSFLVSLDFSHNLSALEAAKRDLVTRQLIRDRDFSSILNLSSEYLDSPPSLVLALKIIDSHALESQFLAHENSSVFNGSDSLVTSYFLVSATAKDDSEFTLVAGGDVMLGRTVNTRMHKYQDFTWPYHKIASFFKEADISLVNLESPFGNNCPLTDTGMVFCADKRSVSGLTFAGIDVVSLANNHIGNQGSEGLEITRSLLASNNIAYVGTGEPVIKSVKGSKVAFLGFNDINPITVAEAAATFDNIEEQIKKIRSEVDLVVTTFHWGNEYVPRSARQVEVAHHAIDSGADIVIGHHPHVTQAVENYKGKPIYYSLGNLVFDQMWSDATRNGAVIRLTFRGNELIKEETHPIKIFDYGQPIFQPINESP